MKKNKGITLIALVITVIILLILAGVAISMITGGEGLFAKANDAATKYNQSAQNEADMLNQLLNSNYLNTDGNGETEEIRNLSDMVKDGTIKVGDYINYSVGLGTETNNGEYTVTTEETGWEEDQKYNVTSYKGGWRVCRVYPESGDIEVISDGNVLSNDENNSLILKGVTGWKRGVVTLNKMAKCYVNPSFAVSSRVPLSDGSESLEDFTDPDYPDVELPLFTYDREDLYDDLVEFVDWEKTWYCRLTPDIWDGSRYNYAVDFGPAGEVYAGKGMYMWGATQTVYDWDPWSYEFAPIIKLRSDLHVKIDNVPGEGTSKDQPWRLK